MEHQLCDTEQPSVTREFAGAFVYFWDVYNDPNINTVTKVYLANKLMNLYNRESHSDFVDFKTLFETLKNNDTIVAYHSELLNESMI